MQTQRSKTYQSIFSDDDMLEAFGTLRPSVSERTAYFFESWMDWRSTRVKIKNRHDIICRNLCKELGLKEFWEFQVRENEVRFRDNETKAWALMSGLDIVTQKGNNNERI
tara:strand:+ start:1918 stop:2247 length:330 start_codon:yes stop_codon:yes gene_type:complete